MRECLHIGIHYARGGKSLLRVGWTPGNLATTITKSLAGAQQVAGDISETATHMVCVERMEGTAE